MTNSNLIGRAAKIAVLAHKDQKRKSDDSPYIVHPFMVALKLVKHNFEDKVIAAALAHDVLEDSGFTEEDLRAELGSEVLDIVKAVSENRKLVWEERKKQYIITIRFSPECVKAVSISDKIHNLESMLIAYEQFGPKLWEKFNRGKEQQSWFINGMLEVFKETWKHPLVDEYAELVARMDALQ